MKRPLGDLILGIVAATVIWGAIIIIGTTAAVLALKMIGGLR